MPTAKKIELVQNFKQLLKQTQSLILVDYRGMQAFQLEELRRRVEEVDGKFMITKNTLFKLGLQQSGLLNKDAADAEQVLFQGPTAVVLAPQDGLPALKVVTSFQKEFELPSLKGGFLNQTWLDAAHIAELAKLPSRQELQARLALQLNAPLFGLIQSLKGNLSALVHLLQAKADAKAKKGG